MDPSCEPSSLPFAFLLSIENMGSTLCLFMFMRFLLLVSSFYPMVANSSSFMQQPLCHDSERSALLQFKQSFLIDGHASGDPSAYPKVAMWKSHGEGEEGSDCCSWDGVECDRETGHVIGLHLASSCLYGSINSNSTLFSLVHLRRLDLSDNDFNYSQIPFGVGQLSRLRSLDLSSDRFAGQIPSELLALSKLVFLNLSANPMLQLQKPGLRYLVQNLTHLKELHLRIPQCLANLSKSLFILDLGSNNLDGPIPQTCTVPNNLRVIDLGENQFQGQIPRSFANCMMLEHLVLGNNQIDDIFPFWLGALPQLQVLILRSNRFHGAIGSWHSNFRFPKLRIVDLSDNKFIGDLPSEYFQNWDAMKLTDIANDLRYMQARPKFQIPGYGWTAHYMYSMTMTNRGMQRFYEKIPDVFIAIDFSGNNFKGQIPTSIGNLNGFHLLNLGSNNLTGHIPSSLGDLTQLESLDLSQNQLSGEIPLQLTRITFLAFFNVSHNHLTGPIPQGNQFTTFPNASFDGNLGLCGSPLSRACGSSEASPPTSSSSKQGSTSEFDWKFVLMGYGSGLVIGVSIGYYLTSWKHEWFVKTFGKRQRKWTRKERRHIG
ncbi:receptor-like protein 6 isoform X3 [Vitis vinifera]|uniref:receptor-like protein 6 isoform X3 n=1 Tax=Vitis vinifera TaxID=29760 RepID=UPI00053F6253|nr:receptor-like protein 6 isoform X3 [Vitis vinifera]|eukprot:XP_010662268.1 PREDICTED: receptor-like protein 12 isoform X2 [Vitis vinifera]